MPVYDNRNPVDNPYGADVLWEKIERRFNGSQFSGLHYRMSLAQQVYDGGVTLPDRSVRGKDDAVYTSIIPREFVGKVVTQLSETSIVVNTQTSDEPIIRQATDDLRYFVRGCFSAANREALRQAMPEVISQMAYQAAMRGWICARSMMNVKEVQGIDTTFPEIDIWDGLDTVWANDINGLLWMARKRVMPPDFDGNIRENTEGVTVYEYIDRTHYCVITQDPKYGEVTLSETEERRDDSNDSTQFVIRPVEHFVVDNEGRAAVPGIVLPIGSRTLAHNGAFGTEPLSRMGVSILENLIPVIERYNLMGTNWLTQERQETERKLIYKSNAHNPEVNESLQEPGEDLNLKNDENIEAVPIKSGISPNSDSLRDLILAETELATFASIVSGSLGRNLSGYAIRQLTINSRQKIHPYLATMERAIESISLLLRGHFQTGAFGRLPVIGRTGLNNSYFEKEIAPDILRLATGFDIKLRPRREKLIPEDVNTALQVTQAGILPLASVLVDILDIDDPEEQMRELTIEQIERADPLLAISRAIEAFADTGQLTQAFYLTQMFNLNYQNLVADLGLQQYYKKFQIEQLQAAVRAGNVEFAELIANNLRQLGVSLLGQPAGAHPLSIPGGQSPQVESNSANGPERPATALKGTRQFGSQRGAEVNAENATLDRGGNNG